MNSRENSFDKKISGESVQGKMQYRQPVLQVFGSVRVLTKGAFTNGNDAGAGRKNPSDRVVKQNIVRIGDHPLGIGLYLFDYKPEFRDEWGYERQFGVMADEVEAVMPDAVSVHSNGFKTVDYAKLGIVRQVH